ncbi:MAG: carboxypeptidase-like regulatory domain-containing protein [Flavobacteriaceae bacterium]|nr:carboxypeptidase-like regulatory domain-containing protein [Flavobacteriaceae bacterium]
MKTTIELKSENPSYLLVFLFLAIGYFQTIPQLVAQQVETNNYVEYKGLVLSSNSKKVLEFSNIAVDETNISTISNSEGEFVLKVPANLKGKSVTISYLGYENKTIPLSRLNSNEKNIIKLKQKIEKLSEINVISKDPDLIIKNLLKNRQKNYTEQPIIMKAFYRESIKKRRAYASLSEAVVDIYRKPIKYDGRDFVRLNKVRKSTNYKKIDTLIIKLQGGPFNNLNMDVIKNKGLIFDDDVFNYYKFSFDKVISVNNRATYVVNFTSNGYASIPLYYGKLYVDAQTYALSKAFFSLNLDDKKKASRFLVKKKPSKAEVIPMIADYRVDYRFKDGKWYYGYSRIELAFKIDWTKRLFNSLYNITIEMAITNWKTNEGTEKERKVGKMRPNVILHDKATGFSDPEFWGEYNIIEPEKSIENAIKKIKRQLNKKK